MKIKKLMMDAPAVCGIAQSLVSFAARVSCLAFLVLAFSASAAEVKLNQTITLTPNRGQSLATPKVYT